MSKQTTIAAISTPHGRGGIAVVRLSGPEAFEIVRDMLDSKRFAKQQSHIACHGWIHENKEPIDEVIATWFQAPHSYTGEDLVEISCHGGIFISRRILEICIQKGAEPAQPGEFTERAFINGRMDLAQAEAVADLIQARTEASRRVAVYQLEGRLSERFGQIREKLKHACAMLELELDFGEEDVEFASRKELRQLLQNVERELKFILATFGRGRACREGICMALIGRPNVGKSSLLNALIEKERAIVTDQPGTTRDTIEEMLDIEGVLFTISDTAGIRHTGDQIEQEGVARARKAMQDADLVLLVLEGNEPLKEEDRSLLRDLKKENKSHLVVANKTDLGLRIKSSDIEEVDDAPDILEVSCKTGKGMDQLVSKLETIALGGDLPQEGEILLTQERHRNCVAQAVAYLKKAETSLASDMSQEFIALDLRGAMNALEDITGETSPDDILNLIFSEFCIGK